MFQRVCKTRPSLSSVRQGVDKPKKLKVEQSTRACGEQPGNARAGNNQPMGWKVHGQWNQNQPGYFLEPDGHRRGLRAETANGKRPYTTLSWALPHPAEKRGEVAIATSTSLLPKRPVTPTRVPVCQRERLLHEFRCADLAKERVRVVQRWNWGQRCAVTLRTQPSRTRGRFLPSG